MKELIEALQKAFETFKASVNEELAQIKAKGHADPLLTEKIEKINADITTLTAMKRQMEAIEAKISRPGFAGGASEEDAAKAAHKKAFIAFVRNGVDASLRDLQIKAAVTTADNTAGGYAIPTELDRAIGEYLETFNPMRALCNVINIGTSDYKKLFQTGKAAGGWVGETDARPETGTPTLAELAPFWGEEYANPAASQDSLQDLFFDVEAWLVEAVGEILAEYEGTSFTTGNGVKKPKGILAYATALTTDATRPFGTLQHVVTGAAADFTAASATVSPADCLIDVIQALKKGYRANASWQANSLTMGKVRKFKDFSTGNFIWQPGIIAGQPDTLLGYRVEENEDFPDVGAGALAMAFGDWKRGYTIVDRLGTQITLRDPYTNKPYVHFYHVRRVGGFLVDSRAIKILKVSA